MKDRVDAIAGRCARVVSCILSLVIALSAPTVADASSTPGVSCSESSPSAVNQYCENIPSATGGHEVTPGTPALATALPAETVRRLNARPAVVGASAQRAAAARQALLRLPAPGPRHNLGAGAGLAKVSGWSVLWPAVGILTLAALSGAALGVHRRLRRRADAEPLAAD